MYCCIYRLNKSQQFVQAFWQGSCAPFYPEKWQKNLRESFHCQRVLAAGLSQMTSHFHPHQSLVPWDWLEHSVRYWESLPVQRKLHKMSSNSNDNVGHHPHHDPKHAKVPHGRHSSVHSTDQSKPQLLVSSMTSKLASTHVDAEDASFERMASWILVSPSSCYK